MSNIGGLHEKNESLNQKY